MKTTKRIYLDHAATTPVAPEVISAMHPFFTQHFGNASSLYEEGQYSQQALQESRRLISEFLNAKNGKIIFTSSGTESNNLAIKGLAYSHLAKTKNHIIISSIEHPSIIETCEFLKKKGFEITRIKVSNTGLIRLQELESAITPKTLLVSIMHANNEIGTIQDIDSIGKLCRKKGTIFHTDAVQSFGKIPIDVEKMDIGLLSASAHKIYGPKGVGLMFIRNGIDIEPVLHGGGHEFTIRSSTENIPGIIGLAKAVELCRNDLNTDNKKLIRLRDMLTGGLLQIKGTRLNGHLIQRLPNNVNISFAKVEGESMVMQLDARGISISTGSACSTKNLEPSHVLLAIGLDHVTAHGSLRFTLGRSTTEKEIQYVINSVKEVVENLRKMSPL